MQEQRWTLDELADRVDAALTVDYAGPPSARVRAVPDRRAIRWYTTIGLIDRPVAHRGRTALYGPRHLLQLVAVKRLQASGLPLVAIQQELAGASDTQLARVARLPGGPAALPGGGSSLDRDSAPRPAAAAGQPAAGQSAAEQPVVGPPRAVSGRARRGGFWREQAATFTAAPGGRAAPGRPALDTAALGTSTDSPDPELPVATLRGVRLGEGATLLLEPGRQVDAADVEAVLNAARPLLAVLRERGLGRPAGDLGPGPVHRPAGEHQARREHQ
jgi:DNA-binding transcriptional MerR regulator